MLMALALFLAPCTAFAVSENVASANTPPAADLSAGDIDQAFKPGEAQRLTLEERLSLQNAVCALWNNAQKQEPAPVESLDIMKLEAPDHVFVQGYYFAHEGWVFEGIIRHMVPDSTGIEVISRIQNYRVQFQRLENGGFKVVSAVFSEVGMG